MNSKTKIEWTDATWNPVTGCTKVSQGCKHCYAERQWPRLTSIPGTLYSGRSFTDVECHAHRLDQPLRWKKPRRIFVNSMSDLFHESVPFEFIASVFAVMSVTTRHQYQVLTKRPDRMLEFFKWVLMEKDNGCWYPIKANDFGAGDRIFDHWPEHINWVNCGYDNCGPLFPFENVWLGVSVEDQETADERIPLLLQTPAAIRWLSIEPLLGPVDLTMALEQFHTHDPLLNRNPSPVQWVVVGGESGPKARPMHPDWVRSLRKQCQTANVPFFFKQWGEWRPVDGLGEAQFSGAPTTVFKSSATGPSTFKEMANRTVVRVGKKAAGRELDGKIYSEYPA